MVIFTLPNSFVAGVRETYRIALVPVILSLLTDICLFFHPSQTARLKNKRSAWNAGNLCEKIRKDSLLVPSEKHLINRDLGRLEPTPALIYKNKAQITK